MDLNSAEGLRLSRDEKLRRLYLVTYTKRNIFKEITIQKNPLMNQNSISFPQVYETVSVSVLKVG
ncbi:uncharacterized, partial [Tachysurus ichikawai]